jgi:hypothetical protein
MLKGEKTMDHLKTGKSELPKVAELPKIIAIMIPIGSYGLSIVGGKLMFKNNKKVYDTNGELQTSVKGLYEVKNQPDLSEYSPLGLLSKIKDTYTAKMVYTNLKNQDADLINQDYAVLVTKDLQARNVRSHEMSSLNGYFHAKVSCQYWDSIVSDKQFINNKQFLDLITNARKHSRILIKAIEESYKEANIDIATIEQENDIMFEIMEATEELTDKIDVKFNTIK